MQGKPLVLLLSVLYGSAFIAGFNENLVNMALVSIMAEYGVDSVTAQWLVTGYMIVATVVVTCMAFLYRRFHVRTLFFGAAGLSIVGSAMGLVAPSFELLLVARLVQAVGTGIFIPLMMNTILVVTPKNKLGTYLSVGGCMITFGPAFAPVVCGALVTAFGWHSIFVVPIVAMAVLAVLGFFYMKNLETHEAHLDVLSVLLSAVALTVLSFGLTQLTTDGVLAVAALVLAAAMVAVFVVRQLRCAHPLIDLAPMKNRAFWPAIILVTIAMMSMFSMSVLLPLYFEGAAGMTAFAAGLVILVPVLANAAAQQRGAHDHVRADRRLHRAIAVHRHHVVGPSGRCGFGRVCSAGDRRRVRACDGSGRGHRRRWVRLSAGVCSRGAEACGRAGRGTRGAAPGAVGACVHHGG